MKIFTEAHGVAGGHYAESIPKPYIYNKVSISFQFHWGPAPSPNAYIRVLSVSNFPISEKNINVGKTKN